MKTGYRSKHVALALVVSGLVLAAACGSETVPEPEAVQDLLPSPATGATRATETAKLLSDGTKILAEGEFQLPAAGAFGELGFHEVLTATHDLPSDLGSMAGSRLVLKLWDAGRPERNCSSEHPLSGCATVDWSDAPGRPNVPSGGVFGNRILLQSVDGERSFFLSESGALNDSPDTFDPG